MKFGVSIYSLRRQLQSGMTAVEAVKWLAENGSEVIELVPIVLDMATEGEKLVAELVKTAKQYGSQIANYSIGANFLKENDKEYEEMMAIAKSHIDIVAKNEIPSIRIDSVGFGRPPETNVMENFQADLPVIIKAYRELCDYASSAGVTVLTENHGFYVNGSDRMRQLILGVGRDNFGHQLDVGNYACVDDICEVAVDKMVGLAKVVHMKDFYIRSGKRNPGDAPGFSISGAWFRSQNGRYLRGSIMGQGDLDIPAMLGIIKAAGFSGNFYIEYEGIEDCLYGTKVGLDNLKRIYESV